MSTTTTLTTVTAETITETITEELDLRDHQLKSNVTIPDFISRENLQQILKTLQDNNAEALKINFDIDEKSTAIRFKLIPQQGEELIDLVFILEHKETFRTTNSVISICSKIMPDYRDQDQNDDQEKLIKQIYQNAIREDLTRRHTISKPHHGIAKHSSEHYFKIQLGLKPTPAQPSEINTSYSMALSDISKLASAHTIDSE